MTRAELRTYWAERGHADDFDTLMALLESHKAKLERVMALAGESGHTRSQHRMLDTLAKRARSYHRMVCAAMERPVLHPTHGDLGRWGRNGCAPTIDDIVSSAEFQATFEPLTDVRAMASGAVAA